MLGSETQHAPVLPVDVSTPFVSQRIQLPERPLQSPPVIERPAVQQPEQVPRPEQTQNEVREERLKKLFGLEYGYVESSGLADLFYYNPETGEDGLVHTLAGDADPSEGGVAIPGGFHHEESGKIWGTITDPETGEERDTTRVEREHLEAGNSEYRKRFRERRAEPFLAHVAIADQPKMALTKDKKGDTHFGPAKVAMYPKEYDSLAVMQTVRTAYENFDPAEAREGINDRGNPVLIVQGKAILIDGVTTMPIRMVLDKETKKIMTAHPIISGKAALMNLTEDQMVQHMTYQTPTSSIRN